ncbi:MAG: DNA primase [Selenomonadaceae bacterium]|nr:DNA primase [Selenomonadaceae bacterium]
MRSAELDEFVERVNERTDIYSVVSRYVQLTQRNGRYWGRCPFHNEKTASFCVSADKGLFYCFGCGAGGNAFKFLSLIENISYFEAIKLQAQRLDIDLPTRKLSPEEERRRREEKDLFKINELAQDFYHESLIKTARGEVGRKYLEARGITAETIENFKLGFAPEEWDNLLTTLRRKGFSHQQIETVGLITKSKNSSGYYDRFRGRIMIPITDIFGHVVGFGGRVLEASDNDTPKYLNTSETPIFNKRNLLFGLDKSNRAISSAGKAIVVEGYMDAISLFSAGIKNVVASLGTAFTPEHAKLITRYTKKIIFCYDSDEAGQKATIRALPIVQAAGAEVFIIKVPDGKDPDEFIRKHGKEEFETLIKNAETMIDYRINYVVDHSDLSTISGKVRALHDILPVVANVDSEVLRNEYRKKISSALVMDEHDIASEWKNFSSKTRQENFREPEIKTVAIQRPILPDNDTTSQVRLACEDILRLSWHDTEALEYALKLVPREIFTEPHREIIKWYRTCAAEERRPDQMRAAEELSEAAYAELSRIFIDGFETPPETDLKVFDDAVNFLRLTMLKKKYKDLVVQAEKQASNDKETYNKTVEESLKIKKEIDKLQNNP